MKVLKFPYKNPIDKENENNHEHLNAPVKPQFVVPQETDKKYSRRQPILITVSTKVNTSWNC